MMYGHGMPRPQTKKGTHTMNTMLTTLGTQAEFHQTWQALMRQLETLLSIAHMRRPNRTQTLEAVSIAKHLLGKVGDQLDKANPE
jgi:hypothetical protein